MDEGAGSCILAAGMAWVDEILYICHMLMRKINEREKKNKFSSKVV